MRLALPFVAGLKLPAWLAWALFSRLFAEEPHSAVETGPQLHADDSSLLIDWPIGRLTQKMDFKCLLQMQWQPIDELPFAQPRVTERLYIHNLQCSAGSLWQQSRSHSETDSSSRTPRPPVSCCANSDTLEEKRESVSHPLNGARHN